MITKYIFYYIFCLFLVNLFTKGNFNKQIPKKTIRKYSLGNSHSFSQGYFFMLVIYELTKLVTHLITNNYL